MLQYQIAITLLPGIGDINGKKLMEHCGGVEAVFTEKKQSLKKIPGIGDALVAAITNGRSEALARAEKEMLFIEKYKITSLFYTEDHYPHRLRNCIDSPMMLYFKGNCNLNQAKVLSIVGTRSATEYGRNCCKAIVEGFAGRDVLIASGLAQGIDTCAHKEALKNKLETVGVLGHGLDRLYPSENRALAEKMLESGGLLTDFMSETNPDRENFPRRNRIIAGMADATLVVEAAKKGGALITADIANSYNRDVFAVPGRIGDAYSEGCNYFIKINKAALVQSADDIKYIMKWKAEEPKTEGLQRKLFINLSPDEEAIIALLTETPELSIDSICYSMQTTMSRVATALLNMEFEGIIKRLPGKMYRLQ